MFERCAASPVRMSQAIEADAGEGCGGHEQCDLLRLRWPRPAPLFHSIKIPGDPLFPLTQTHT